MAEAEFNEARRQLGICNACRYCEGCCAVFPSLHKLREFSDQQLVQFANLCHNCRGCHYSCQYTEPHEFALNVPAVLDEVRRASWQNYAWPSVAARHIQTNGVAVLLMFTFGIALLLWLIALIDDTGQSGFYGLMPHSAMVSLFLPAFLLPILVLVAGVRRFIKDSGVQLGWQDWWSAICSAVNLRNLKGGHGDGCNFEQDDTFSHMRRWWHQVTVLGFMLCFAATAVATLLHYVWIMPAPYEPLSLVKLLGVSGGLFLCAGTLALMILKVSADSSLDAKRVAGGDFAFVLSLFLVSASRLALYWAGDSLWLRELLALHLGCVLTFFVLTPYSKMSHGFFRMAALAIDAYRARVV